MSTPEPKPQDDCDPPATQPVEPGTEGCARLPFDWQAVLLRYLPEPLGTSHTVKRLAAR